MTAKRLAVEMRGQGLPGDVHDLDAVVPDREPVDQPAMHRCQTGKVDRADLGCGHGDDVDVARVGVSNPPDTADP